MTHHRRTQRPRLGTTRASRAIQALAEEVLQENDWSRHLSEFVGPDTKEGRNMDRKRKVRKTRK